jgi:glutamyl-tRNA reductase
MKIVIIGSGNLATNLSLALEDAGQDIVQIFSRTEAHAKELADKVGCS